MKGRHHRTHLIDRLGDQRIQPIHALTDHRERERTGRFFTHGIRFIAQAVQHHAEIETLVVAPALLTSPFGQQLTSELRQSGVPTLHVAAELFRALAGTEEAQGIGAVVRQQWHKLSHTSPRAGLCWVALDRVQSPGNLGTIIRTCDAVGAAGLILIGDAVDPHHPAAVRATMGSLFGITLVRTTLPQFTEWKRQHRVLLVGTSPSATVSHRDIEYRQPLALFMGWERKGLSPRETALCDVLARIPMCGSADSLNLAVATGVMLYEVLNRFSNG